MTPRDLQPAHEEIQRFRAADRPDWQDHLTTDEAALRDLAHGLDMIGIEAFNADDVDLALDAFWLQFLARLALVRKHPTSRDDIRDVASAQDLLATVLIRQGRLDSAEPLVREALDYRRGLYDDDPTDAHAADLFGKALQQMGTFELANGDATAARDWFVKAQAQLRHVDAQWSGISFVADALAELSAALTQ